MSTREIGIRVGVAASTVRRALRRVAAAGMVDGISAGRIRRVGVDYHVEVENYFYSFPHRYARAEVNVSRRVV